MNFRRSDGYHHNARLTVHGRELLCRAIVEGRLSAGKCVSRILRWFKFSRMRDLEPCLVVQRYEYPRPGDLLHFDIKKLVQIAQLSHHVTGDRRDTVPVIGTEAVNAAIDDYS